MQAIYVCKCIDGTKQEFKASTEETVEDIKKRASEQLHQQVADLIDEIRLEQEKERDEEPLEDEEENAEPENAEPKFRDLTVLECVVVPNKETPTTRIPVPITIEPEPDWKNEKFRKSRKPEPAIYQVAGKSKHWTIRGNVAEPLEDILKRAKRLHACLVLTLSEEIPLGEDSPETPSKG